MSPMFGTLVSCGCQRVSSEGLKCCGILLIVCFKLKSGLFSKKSWNSKKISNSKKIHSPAGIYLLKVNNRNTRTRCEICSKLTIKTLERCHWRSFGVFIVNFEHISYLFSSVFIVKFEHVIAGWVVNPLKTVRFSKTDIFF